MKKGVMCCLSVCGLLITVYLGGVWFFHGHFGLADCNGMSVSFTSVSLVSARCLQEASFQPFVFVREDGFEEQVTVRQLGMSYGISDGIVLSNAFVWPVWAFQRKSYDLAVVPCLDEMQLQEGLSHLDCVSTEYLRNASESRFVETDTGLVLQSASRGTNVDADRLYAITKERLLSKEYRVDLVSDGCYVQTDLLGSDLWYDLPADYVFPSDFSVDLEAGVWESFPAELFVQCVLDGRLSYDGVCAFVRYLKEVYDTKGLVRPFLTQTGRMIELPVSDQDTYAGWDLDVERTADGICQAILSGQNQSAGVWVSKGVSHGDLDIGDTYLELDLTNQMLYYVEQWVCKQAIPVVTGLDIEGRQTPTGLFRMLAMERDYTMYGDYGSAFSKYFIRLTSNGVGIHDASWRDQFLPEDYLTNGSHGCINVPEAEMAVLFEDLYANHVGGIPVVVYK